MLVLIGAWLPLPAGAAVAFTARLDDGWRVHVQMEPDAAPMAVPAGIAPGDHGAPAISADGRLLAFEVAGKGSVVCRIDDWECVQAPQQGTFAVRPSWRGSTTRLFLVEYSVSADREDSRIVALDVEEADSGLKFASDDYRVVLEQTGNQDYPAVSRDGRWLVYSSAQLIAPYRATSHVLQSLWSLDLSTGVPRPVTLGDWQDIQAAWSPGGDRLAFASNRHGQFNLFVMSMAGGEPRRLVDEPGPKSWPAWSPQGDELMFTWVRDNASELWIVPLTGGDPRPFRPFGNERAIEIRDGDWR